MGGGLKLRTKRDLKRVNEIKPMGLKIRYLMDLLQKRNMEIRFLRKKLWDLEHGCGSV